MSNKVEKFNNLPRWLQRMIPLTSVVLFVLAFSYVTYLYNQESLELMQWIRLIIFTTMGMVLILSAIVYVFDGELSWKCFIGGLGLLPILLLLQLLIFLLTMIRMFINSTLQGNLPEKIQMFIENYPSKFDIVILAVLFIIGVFWIINKLRKKSLGNEMEVPIDGSTLVYSGSKKRANHKSDD